jgi:hypothetical protein
MIPRNAMKFLAGCACLAAVLLANIESAQSAKRPNILVIWGDDIGTWNISYNNRGLMGYETPNIDRIATEGVGSLTQTKRSPEEDPVRFSYVSTKEGRAN